MPAGRFLDGRKTCLSWRVLPSTMQRLWALGQASSRGKLQDFALHLGTIIKHSSGKASITYRNYKLKNLELFREGLNLLIGIHLRNTAAVALVAALVGGPQEASAQAADMVDVVGRLGITFLEESSRREDATASVSDAAAHKEAALAAMARYEEMRRAYASAQSGGRGFAAITDGVIGGSAAVGNVPGVVVGVILRGAVGYANAELDSQIRQVSIEYLNAVSETILQGTEGTDLTTLALEDRNGLQRVLEERQDLLEGVRKKAVQLDDPALVATAAATIAQAAHDAANAGVILGATNAADTRRIDAQLTEFMSGTRASLALTAKAIEGHATRIDALKTDIEALDGSVHTVAAQLGQLGANQDLVVDFIYSRMTLEERAAALETGLIDRRISCPEGKPDCDVTAVREALIERYRDEAEVVRTFEAIGSVLQDAGTALQIVRDLNIDVPPEISEGLEIANAAFIAVTTWSTNPLGSIQAITSVFGSKRDVEAERHAALMNYLAKNFENINQQLKQIQENQQAMMDGLAAVSGQIADMHRDLDSRLSALQSEVLVIGKNVRAVIWEDLQSCAFVFQQARNPVGLNRDGFIDLATLDFLAFEDRIAFSDDHGRQVTNCMDEISETVAAFRNPRGWSTFGSFIDLNRSVLQAGPELAERLRLAGEQDGIPDYRNQAERYVEKLVKPSANILRAWASRNDIDVLTLLHILSEQPMNMRELEQIRTRLGLDTAASDGPWRFACDETLETYPLIAEITCEGEDPQGMATIYLTEPLATQPIHDLSREVVVASQLADLYRGVNEGFTSSLAEVATMDGVPRGREMVETLLAMATIAVAYEQRLNGGITALAIAEDILEGRTLGADHYAILSSNPYLAQNVMTILMHRWVGASNIEDAFEVVSFVNRYTNAIVYSRSGAEHPLDQLHAMFSNTQDRTWGMDKGNGRAVFVVGTEAGPVELPLPGPMQVAEGRFDLPAGYERLVSARELLIDRLIAYELAEEDLVPVLLAGLRLP